jgi:hypothetical protein
MLSAFPPSGETLLPAVAPGVGKLHPWGSHGTPEVPETVITPGTFDAASQTAKDLFVSETTPETPDVPGIPGAQ